MNPNRHPVPRDHGEINALLAAQWVAPDLLSRPAADWQRRLAIIVPYRDRAQHLRQLLPHLHDYFRIDKLDRHIPLQIHVVEQADARPFNRGRLINAGFHLAGNEADYLCLHDVDLLPIWADYAFPRQPARLCWYGSPNSQQKHLYIGGVTAISCADFRTLNGFSNDYWGWGYEDHDLRLRMIANGLKAEARDGAFRALSHPHNGFTGDGGETEAGRRNRERIEALHRDGFTAWARDGLNSLAFGHLDSAPLQIDGRTWEQAMHHRVRFD
ncbi:MAG TPA: galactosyltransferase-related protein [Patescibacteria group bacterium]|nr:galactosyltransferase-related protein [Patescibacteria group bacterium]